MAGKVVMSEVLGPLPECPLGAPRCQLDPMQVRERCYQCPIVTQDSDPGEAGMVVLAAAMEHLTRTVHVLTRLVEIQGGAKR